MGGFFPLGVDRRGAPSFHFSRPQGFGRAGECARLDGAGLRLWDDLWVRGGSMREHKENQLIILV